MHRAHQFKTVSTARWGDLSTLEASRHISSYRGPAAHVHITTPPAPNPRGIGHGDPLLGQAGSHCKRKTLDVLHVVCDVGRQDLANGKTLR